MFGRFAREDRGATAVEFAIVAIPFLMLLFSVLEFGRLMWTREALQETAIAAARCMGLPSASCASSGVYSAGSTTSFIQSTASTWGVTIPTADITQSRTATCAGVSNFSSVTITYTFQTAAPELLSVLSGGTTLTVNACFPNNS